MLARPKLYVVAGPTAVGKTAAALALAEQLQTEIISADSRQCFSGMAIGTAQATAEEQARIPHHFVACLDPEAHFSAADFAQFALKQLEDIFERCGNNAVMAGGTGLYIKAVCTGLDDMPPTDEDIAAEVEALAQAGGKVALQEALRKEDPLFTREIDNPARLQRALAFVRSTGKSITLFQTGAPKPRPFDIIKIGLELPRAELYERINKRVDIMLEAGLEDEVRALFDKRHLRSLNTVGYAELFAFFEGKSTREEAIEKIKQHSRNYAKRQMTWFKRDPEFRWFTPQAFSTLLAQGRLPG